MEQHNADQHHSAGDEQRKEDGYATFACDDLVANGTEGKILAKGNRKQDGCNKSHIIS